LAFGGILLQMSGDAQLDLAALTARFGPPVNRGMFRTPRGFDLKVEYGVNGEVCRLEMPGEPEAEMRRFLDDLVPESMRGNEVTHGLHIVGGVEIRHVFDEQVIIYETDIVGWPKTLLCAV
jgi:hypothetical protein